METTQVLEIFSDFVWPWCYLVTGRVERLKEQYGLSLRWTHFPLHPETPDSGLTLEELFRGRGYDIEAMKQRMSGLMAEENLPYGNRSHTYNSRLAQELSKWGESFPEGEALNRKLFEAYFVEGLNLAEAEVLLDVTEATGLSRKAAEEVIRERRFRNAVDADWRRAHELGVTGVPTFFSGTSGLVGAQNYEALEQLIQLEWTEEVSEFHFLVK